MLPVAVLRRAKRPSGPSASPASATLRSPKFSGFFRFATAAPSHAPSQR